MNHKVVSFYFDPMPNLKLVVSYQKRVFEYFGLNVDQISFPVVIKHQHSGMMNQYLRSLKNWDVITFFDLDCVPTDSDPLKRALEIVSDGNTIYGNSQASNNQIPFAAPNFLTFTRDVWEKTLKIWEEKTHLDKDIFKFQTYWKDGNRYESDVAEMFNIENRNAGTNIVLAYPTKNEGIPEWKYTGGKGYPDFSWGNGTWFSSNTFHGTEARFGEKQNVFFDVCERILNGK